MGIDITLANIGHGALAEKFDDALVEVVQNTCDPNTDPGAKRKLIVELTFTPNKNEREQCNLEAKVYTKLGHSKALESQVSMGFDQETGEIAAIEHAPYQVPLFNSNHGSMGEPAEPKINNGERS